MYERPADRRFDHDVPEKRQEAAMLLDAEVTAWRRRHLHQVITAT